MINGTSLGSDSQWTQRVTNHTLCLLSQILVEFSTYSLTCRMWTTFLFVWLHHLTCRILVPQPGMEPMPFAVGVWSFYRWTTSKSQMWAIIIVKAKWKILVPSIKIVNQSNTQRDCRDQWYHKELKDTWVLPYPYSTCPSKRLTDLRDDNDQ